MTANSGSSRRLLGLLVWVPWMPLSAPTATGELLNVYESPLEPCSASGMAMAGEYGAIRAGNDTGGYCIGNYSICVDLSTVEGDEGFCKVMEEQDQGAQINDVSQENLEWWCSQDQDKLACHDQPDESCPVEAWCLSPDTFALYLSDLTEDGGGCDAIRDISCKSIHQGAVWALLDESRNSTAHDAAISCLIDRCGMYQLSALTSKSGKHTVTDLVGYGAAIAGMTLAALLFMYRTAREPDIKEELLAPEMEAAGGSKVVCTPPSP